MEFTIDQRDFLRGLAQTHGVADKKSSMPILANVLLTAEGTGKIRMSATDLYIGISSMVAAQVNKGGSITVAARRLFDIVKALPEGEITWTLDPASLTSTLTQGKIRYTIPGIASDDFPPLPNPEDAGFMSLDAAHVAELIAMTSFSMSHDDTRPKLAGSLFEGDGKTLRMVTTDGHRLSKAEAKLKSDSMLNYTMLVPHKGVGELKRLVDDAKGSKNADAPPQLEIAMAGSHAFFRRDDVLLSVKLIDERYPKYAQVIPQRHEKRAVALRRRLLEALRRISLVASNKTGGVELHLEDGLLRVSSKNLEGGSGADEFEVDYAGDALSIGFNAQYLIEVLSALPNDEIALELTGELDPGLIRPVGDGPDFVGVIMPMKL